MTVKRPILQGGKLSCSIDFIKLGFSESNMLSEVGNKALQHNFNM